VREQDVFREIDSSHLMIELRRLLRKRSKKGVRPEWVSEQNGACLPRTMRFTFTSFSVRKTILAGSTKLGDAVFMRTLAGQ
jgi:hypothetical protein